jgi:hypothetical protein
MTDVRGKNLRETHKPSSHCSLTQDNEYSMLYVHVYWYAAIVQHVFPHTKIWQEQATWALCNKAMKRIPILKKRRRSSLTVNTPIQVFHQVTEHHSIQHTFIKKTSLGFQIRYCLQLTLRSFSKIINCKLHKCIYVSEMIYHCRHTPWRWPYAGRNM